MVRFLRDYDELFPVEDDVSLLQQASSTLYPLLSPQGFANLNALGFLCAGGISTLAASGQPAWLAVRDGKFYLKKKRGESQNHRLVGGEWAFGGHLVQPHRGTGLGVTEKCIAVSR